MKYILYIIIIYTYIQIYKCDETYMSDLESNWKK